MSGTPDLPGSTHEIPLDELRRAGLLRRMVGDVEILVTLTAEGPRVYSGLCPHLGGPLLEGDVNRGVLRCSWHAYEFDLVTGHCLTAPGGPWRSQHGGCRNSEAPLEIELVALEFDELGDRIRVHLGARGPAAS